MFECIYLFICMYSFIITFILEALYKNFKISTTVLHTGMLLTEMLYSYNFDLLYKNASGQIFSTRDMLNLSVIVT